MTPQEAFDEYHQAVFSFAYRLTRRADLAEDITQECFLAFVRSPERFDPARGTVKTYLFAIARNLTLKYFRDFRGEEALAVESAIPALDPREELDISTAVASAIAELPPLQQESLVLFEYAGLTLEEIAEVTRMDTGAIKSRLHRARERLRKRLAPYRKRNAHGSV
jgi:RNA polymerase sigma-70 factor (ECF subfamily)